MQIPELLAQRKFDTAGCHAHSSAHKPPKTVTPTVLMLEMYCSHQYLSINPKKVCHAHLNAHKLKKIVNMNADISETIKDRKLGFQI